MEPTRADQLSRRTLLRGATATGLTASAAMLLPGSAAAAAPAGQYRQPPVRFAARTKLVLLGTAGGPIPAPGRKGISHALVVGDAVYVVDCGSGFGSQLVEAGLDPAAVRSIFLSHLHSDHVVDLFSFFLIGPHFLPQVKTGVDVYGPGPAGALPVPPGPPRPVPLIAPEDPTPGTAALVDRAFEAWAYDVNVRLRDEGRPDLRERIRPHEIEVPDVGASPSATKAPDMEPFLVTEDDDVRVTATLVDHAPVFPSFAFRFDTAEGSIAFSGDTGESRNLVRLARDVDVLVHEVINVAWVAELARRQNIPQAGVDHLLSSHTPDTRVGAVATAAGAKSLVLTHLVPPSRAEVSDAQWYRAAKANFSGSVSIGANLDEVPVGCKTRYRGDPK